MDNQIKEESIRGFTIKFRTKPGVFAKHGLDDGTKLLLEKLEISDGTLVADLGSGTGIIGFVAAKLNPNGHIHLLDDHLRSAELAKENLELNNLKNVEVFLSDLFSAVKDRTYNLIVSNPPQSMGNEFINEIVTESFKHLKSEGQLWLIVKNNIKPVIERMLKDISADYKVIAQGREHVVIKATK